LSFVNTKDRLGPVWGRFLGTEFTDPRPCSYRLPHNIKLLQVLNRG